MIRKDLKDLHQFSKEITDFLEYSLIPFPFISELGDLKEISTFQDILRLNSFVYSLVPWTEKYFDNTILSCLCNSSSVDYLYRRMQRKEIGGWCGLPVDFMSKILTGYEIPHQMLNVGFMNKGLTHMALIVSIDLTEYLIDPYLCEHYTDDKNNPLAYEYFLKLIRRGKYDQIHINQGDTLKSVQKGDSWLMLSPQEFKDYALIGFMNDLKEPLRAQFGSDNFFNIYLVSL